MKGTYDLDTFAMIATFCFAVLLVLKVVKPITDIVVSSTYLHLQATAKQHLKIGMAAGLESDSESGETGRASKSGQQGENWIAERKGRCSEKHGACCRKQ